MTSLHEQGRARRAAARSSWSVAVYRLGAEPGDDLRATTTPEQRLEMMWPLTVEAWGLAGLRCGHFLRATLPVGLRRLSESPPPQVP